MWKTCQYWVKEISRKAPGESMLVKFKIHQVSLCQSGVSRASSGRRWAQSGNRLADHEDHAKDWHLLGVNCRVLISISKFWAGYSVMNYSVSESSSFISNSHPCLSGESLQQTPPRHQASNHTGSSSNWSKESASWPGVCVGPVPFPPSIPLFCLAISAVQWQCFHFPSVYINLKLLTQLCCRMFQTMPEAINK